MVIFLHSKKGELLKNQLKVVLVGGPGTGKTSVINTLEALGHTCFKEVSRSIIAKAQKEGIEQLFLEDPMLFSKMLLEGREQQFLAASELDEKLIFFDRGIPDVWAYLKYAKTKDINFFKEKSEFYQYQLIFHFAPWEKIHETDEERYESFAETTAIDRFLIKTYQKLGYHLVDVPFGTISERTQFIINYIQNLP